MENEKRRARRFDLALPVVVISAEQQPSKVVQTRDISSNGLLLELDEEMSAGSIVDMVVTLPGEMTQTGPVHLRCLGHVVRTDRKQPDRVGIAVKIERYEFVRLDDDPSTVTAPN